jgi:hypothetical protein
MCCACERSADKVCYRVGGFVCLGLGYRTSMVVMMCRYGWVRTFTASEARVVYFETASWRWAGLGILKRVRRRIWGIFLNR